MPSIRIMTLLVLILLAAPRLLADDAKQPKKIDAVATVSDIVKKLRPSLATIRTAGRDGGEHGIGTGFVIAADGLIVTNLHVIGRGRTFTVEMADGRKLNPIAVHASDRTVDLAVIRVDVGDKPLDELALGDSTEADQGTRVVAMGNPWGLQNSVVSGIISAKREIEGQELLQLAMPVEPGNSGGPVVDMHGSVIGIVNMKSTIKRSIGFAVQSSVLKVLLEKPNPVPMDRWSLIGAIDSKQWLPLFGADWRQEAGRVKVSGTGQGFGGRSICLSSLDMPEPPFELAVSVKMDDESGAAGLVFHSDGNDKHYGFYPSSGNIRLSCFRGPTVYSWQVLYDRPNENYRPGDWNHLKVRVEKDKLLCYLNGQLVLESRDTTFTTGKVGLVKFRHSVAEFRRFTLAKEIPSTVADAAEVRRVVKQLDDLPPYDSLTDQDLEPLTKSASASLSVLSQRSKALEDQAEKLRQEAEQLQRLADDVRTRSVAKKLAIYADAALKDNADLFRGALLIATLDEADIDIDSYVAEVDRMAEEIRRDLKEDADADSRLNKLDKYLFTDNGFHGSRFEYYHRANSYMNRVIDDREGLPISLSVLYMELGRRLDLNIQGVGLPGHFVVKHVPAEGDEQLIDPFESGKRLTREDASKLVRNATGSPIVDDHLRGVAKQEILSRMLANLDNLAESRGDKPARLRYLEARIALEPEVFQLRGMRAVLHAESGRRASALADLDWILEVKPPGLDLEQVRRMRGFIERQPLR
ncbi:MAG TPA: transglutaminase family protein [Pirellulaceae bacterium]|nr:transglutaminase family protein [Pirellulaceae bacterium]